MTAFFALLRRDLVVAGRNGLMLLMATLRRTPEHAHPYDELFLVPCPVQAIHIAPLELDEGTLLAQRLLATSLPESLELFVTVLVSLAR